AAIDTAGIAIAAHITEARSFLLNIVSFLFIKVVVVSHDTRQNDAALISSLNVVLALLGGYLFTDEPSPEEQCLTQLALSE
uniref:hypothetical protein n=1 Tax=Vibrio alginolyticus TaxID=663 RepID=UPI00301D7A53